MSTRSRAKLNRRRPVADGSVGKEDRVLAPHNGSLDPATVIEFPENSG